MTTATETPIRTRRDPAEVERRRAILKQRAERVPASALSEAEVFRFCECAAARVARTASESERCALASEVAERVILKEGVYVSGGWRVPREQVSPLLLDSRTRDQVKRSAVWRDLADPESERIDSDDWSRDREEWIAPTHGIDAADLAERVASRFPQQQRATVARFLLAASEASRAADGSAIYGPALAERCGCSLATLRKSVQRGREYVQRIDPGDLAEWIAAERDALDDLARDLRNGPPSDPAADLAAAMIAAAMAAERKRPARAQRWHVAGRACALPPRAVHYRERERPAGPGCQRIARAVRPTAHRDSGPMRTAAPERTWTAVYRPACSSYPPGLHASTGCHCHGG